MNVENILKVADAIEQHSIPDLGFNLGWWLCDGEEDRSGHGCRTTACIAGWAIAVRDGGGMPEQRPLNFDWLNEAGDFMGLPNESDRSGYDPIRADLMLSIEEHRTPSEAAAVLRHLAATGEVDWSIASTLTNTNGAK